MESCTQHVLQPCLPVHHTDLSRLSPYSGVCTCTEHTHNSSVLLHCNSKILQHRKRHVPSAGMLHICSMLYVLVAVRAYPDSWAAACISRYCLLWCCRRCLCCFWCPESATPQLSWCGMIWSRQHRSSTTSGRVFWLWRAAGNPVRFAVSKRESCVNMHVQECHHGKWVCLLLQCSALLM